MKGIINHAPQVAVQIGEHRTRANSSGITDVLDLMIVMEMLAGKLQEGTLYK